ncbi:hypothetical protein G6514_001995 [Epicoccum nigrum]|nr:hypothetical protein G6514_001995 [Epicoccum nigrum]
MCARLFRSLEDPTGGLAEDAWLAKPMADAFGYLENCLWDTDRQIVPIKSFNDWRAFSAELLGKIVQIQDGIPVDQPQDLIKQAVSEVMEVVRPWHKDETPERLRAEERRLSEIFFSAVRLASILRRQRALWSVRLPWVPGSSGQDQPLMFDPTSMDDERNNDDVSIEDLKACCVEFIVAPALYKRGTMNGDRFDTEAAIYRAAVVMNGFN